MSLSTLTSQLTLPSPLQPFTPDWPGAERVKMWVKRDDLIHPVISGNKWRKLEATLSALPETCRSIVSFGGGYSNHLHALGYACNQLNLPLTALVRGNYTFSMTPMLNDLTAWGASIQFVDKKTYAKRDDADFHADIRKAYPDALVIPEGGSQQSALTGIKKGIEEISQPFDIVLCPVASGATLAGISLAMRRHQKAVGIAVLKGQGYLEALVQSLGASEAERWMIDHEFHFDGYAKCNPALADFCEHMSETQEFAVEPVYSGKLFYALRTYLERNVFPEGSRLIIIHTGGLQGARR